MTRVFLILLVVLALGGMAYVTLSDGGSQEIGPPAVEPDDRESGTRVSRSGGTESDSLVPLRVPDEEQVVVPDFPWVEPEWKTAMADALAQERINLEVKDVMFDELIERISAQLPYRIDASEVPEKAKTRERSLDARDLPPRFLLDSLARSVNAEVHLRPSGIQLLPVGLEPEWEGDEIYPAGLRRATRILDAGGPEAAPVAKLLPVEFEKKTLEAALREIGHRLRFDIEFDPRVTFAQRVKRLTLKNNTLTAALVLRDVTAAARLTWAAEERRILVTFEDDARAIREERQRAKVNTAMTISVAFADDLLADVAKEIGRQAGVPVVVDQRLWLPPHPRVTLRAGPVPLGRLLRTLAPKIPARYLVRGEAIYLIPPAGR